MKERKTVERGKGNQEDRTDEGQGEERKERQRIIERRVGMGE